MGEACDAASWQPLQPDTARLSLNPAACLSCRSPLAQCDACARACPRQALELDARSAPAELTEACLDCGQCAAACPTGALAAPGFETAIAEVSAGSSAALDCYRVPAEADQAEFRVPCLGGLSRADLVHLARASGQGPILLDRGWCGDCPLGGRGTTGSGARAEPHPAAGAVAEAQTLLAEYGVPAARQPRLEQAPLPAGRARPALPSAAEEARITRRGLARRLLGHAQETRDAVAATGTRPSVSETVPRSLPSTPRERLLTALAELGTAPPPRLAARITISSGCRNHGVCAAICPTGALQPAPEQGAAGLELEPWRCIGCRLCERACPEAAVAVHATGGGPTERQALIRHAQRGCLECGRSFTPRAEEPFCPLCDKSRSFAAEAARLFGGGKGAADDRQEESA